MKTLSTRDKQTPQRTTKGESVLMIEKTFTLNRGPGGSIDPLIHSAINSLGMNLGTSQSSQLLTGVSIRFNDSMDPC